MLLNIGPCGDGTVPLMSRAMMDDGAALNFSQNGTNIKVGCPNFRYDKSHCVRVAEIKVK